MLATNPIWQPQSIRTPIPHALDKQHSDHHGQEHIRLHHGRGWHTTIGHRGGNVLSQSISLLRAFDSSHRAIEELAWEKGEEVLGTVKEQRDPGQ